MDAIVQESQGFFYGSYGVQATYEILPPSAASDSKFWDGTGIPIFIQNAPSPVSSALGFHWTNFPGRFKGTGINPLSNFPYAYPWIYISYVAAVSTAISNAQNPYSFSNAEDFMCPIISHEIFETLGDEDGQHYRYFDNNAASMQHVYFAKQLPDGSFDPSGYTTDSEGVAHFPSLLSEFPSFFAFVIEEAGDAVSRGSSMNTNSFPVNGYRITNYPTRQSFNCYDSSPKVYDRMGHMQFPCIPYGGGHQSIILTDDKKGITYSAQMDNFGPLTAREINKIYGLNYPPFPANTTFLTIKTVLAGSSVSAARKALMEINEKGGSHVHSVLI